MYSILLSASESNPALPHVKRGTDKRPLKSEHDLLKSILLPGRHPLVTCIVAGCEQASATGR